MAISYLQVRAWPFAEEKSKTIPIAHPDTRKHDPYWLAKLHTDALRITEHNNAPYMPSRRSYTRNALGDFCFLKDVVTQCRGWERHKAVVHKNVAKALETFGVPANMHLLVLEMPILSVDGERVAYARNDQKRAAHFEDDSGQNKHLTVTTLAKYLTRHWPEIKADKIRNFCESVVGQYGFTKTMDEMLDIMHVTTAASCMTVRDDDDDDDGDEPSEWVDHPYKVYTPEHGWKLAYAKMGDRYVGRALVNDTVKVFVRTYGKEQGNGYTSSHPGLHGWLEGQGYEYEDEWPEGVKFAKIPFKNSYLAPYLDPGSDRVRDSDTSRNVEDCGAYMMRSNEGEYTWENTNGLPDHNGNSRQTCDDCGCSCNSNDMHYMGNLERSVCDDCSESYTNATGYDGADAYAHDDDVVYAHGQPYVREHIASNDIVELHDGEYVSLDNAVYVDSESEYYPTSAVAANPRSRGEVVHIESEGEYELRENCEWCEHNDEWFNNTDVTEVLEGVYVKDEDVEDYLMTLDGDKFEAAMEFMDYDQDAIDEMTGNWLDAQDWKDDEASLPVQEPAAPVVAAPEMPKLVTSEKLGVVGTPGSVTVPISVSMHQAMRSLSRATDTLALFQDEMLQSMQLGAQALGRLNRTGTVTGRMSSGPVFRDHAEYRPYAFDPESLQVTRQDYPRIESLARAATFGDRYGAITPDDIAAMMRNL